MPQDDQTPRRYTAEKIPRGLLIRMLVYAVIGKLFAAFLFFLFTLGD
ncbi:DUF6126 family protein [Streptomyces hainanensis]|nr:DUF6126 family protein [Streptomyces hainanensis]